MGPRYNQTTARKSQFSRGPRSKARPRGMWHAAAAAAAAVESIGSIKGISNPTAESDRRVYLHERRAPRPQKHPQLPAPDSQLPLNRAVTAGFTYPKHSRSNRQTLLSLVSRPHAQRTDPRVPRFPPEICPDSRRKPAEIPPCRSHAPLLPTRTKLSHSLQPPPLACEYPHASDLPHIAPMASPACCGRQHA